jgi:hypothetical protein
MGHGWDRRFNQFGNITGGTVWGDLNEGGASGVANPDSRRHCRVDVVCDERRNEKKLSKFKL